MKKETIQIKLSRPKARVLEFYSKDTPFRPKKVESKRLYKRKAKHSNKEFSHY